MLDTKLDYIIWVQFDVIFDAVIWAQFDAIFDTKVDVVIEAHLSVIFDIELNSIVLTAWFGHLSPALCHPYLRLKN